MFGLKGWEMRGERGEIVVVIFVWSAPTPAAASVAIIVSSVITPAAVATSATCTPSDIVAVIVTYPVCFDRRLFIVVVAGREIGIRTLGRRLS